MLSAPARGAAAVASVPLPVRAGRSARAPGFSLVELMVAMAIFSVLGVALIALLRSSTAFLEKGQAGSELQDQIENADRLLAEDFANVYIRPATMEGMPDVRFLCDRIPFDNDGDSIVDTKEARICFVRSPKGEASDPLLRNSGTKAGATATIDGDEDVREAEDRDLRAPGGKQEVCWVYVPDGKDGDRGINARDFFVDTFTTAIEPTEVLTEIRIPRRPRRQGAGYSKLERKVGDYATAGVAVSVKLAEDGTFSYVGIGVTGVSPSPFAATDAEQLTVGQQPSEELYRRVGDAAGAQSQPAADIRGPVDYKRAMVSEMTVRSFRKAVERARSFA